MRRSGRATTRSPSSGLRGLVGAPERVQLPSSSEEGAALARLYRGRLWRLVFFANFVGALPQFLGVAAGTGTDPFPTHAVRDAVLFLIAIAIYMAIFAVACVLAARKRIRPVANWLKAVRAPNDRERAAVMTLPRRLALWSVWWWIAAFAWGLPYGILVVFRGLHTPVLYLVFQTAIADVAGCAMGVMLTYLLVERALRGLTGLAVRGSESLQPSGIGALPRLLMALAVGVAVPLAALAIGLVGLDARQRAGSMPAIWVGIGVVLLGGFIVAVVAARAVTDPVNEIRSGFRRLKEGDLDVEIDVDEPGELGELQAGFNDMVKTLREREQMRDVFVRLVGKDVAEHALAHGSTLGGEVREATAMFVDIIGSTPLAQSSSPQEYLIKLNSFFDVVVRAVEDAGGVVNQFQGDGALCIFGAPTDQPDHAVRALRASRELRKALDDFAETSGIQAVIGVSTGDVVAGHVGTSDRHEFTVVGDAVNEAKRLAEQAKSAETKVLVSDATIHAAEGELANWHEAGSVHLRGRSGPTTTHTPNA